MSRFVVVWTLLRFYLILLVSVSFSVIRYKKCNMCSRHNQDKICLLLLSRHLSSVNKSNLIGTFDLGDDELLDLPSSD